MHIMTSIEETSNVTQGLKACKDAFSTCRQAEDDAVDVIADCYPPPTTVTTVSTRLRMRGFQNKMFRH